jgi:hypothetical protein
MASIKLPSLLTLNSLLLNSFVRPLGYLFFAAMLIIPSVLQEWRLALLVLLLGTTLVGPVNDSFRLSRSLVVWTLVCVTTSIVFMAWGAVNNAPGALRVGTVYVLWPILFSWFAGYFTQNSRLISYFRVLAWSALAVEIMIITYIANGLGLIVLPFTFPDELTGASLGVYDGRTRYAFNSIATLIYAVPAFTAYLLLYDGQRHDKILPAWLVMVIVALGWSAVFLSGRRAFVLVMLLCLPITFAVGSIMRTRHIGFRMMGIGVIAAVAFLIVANLAGLNLAVMLNDFMSGFSFADADPSNDGAYQRRIQFDALLAGWQENLLFGHGHGATAGVLRADDQPWAYELSYVALMFQAGLIGFAIYFSAVLWLVLKALMIVRNNPKLALPVGCMVVGLCGFLIANATNPYLSKFDYLWTIFSLVAAVNVSSLGDNRPLIYRKAEL